jgi:hypothetical protein
MEYTITEVGFYSTETYGRDNNHRVMVKLSGGDSVADKDYSAFVQEKPSVGDKWLGKLKKVEKNDKIYWNFEFEKATHQVAGKGYTPTGDLVRLETKVDSLRGEIATLGGILTDIKGVLGGLLKDKEYPEPSDPAF